MAAYIGQRVIVSSVRKASDNILPATEGTDQNQGGPGLLFMILRTIVTFQHGKPIKDLNTVFFVLLHIIYYGLIDYNLSCAVLFLFRVFFITLVTSI